MTPLRLAQCTAVATSLGTATVASGQSTTFDLSFKGGTAADYISSVRKAATTANIVTSADVDRVPMPAVDLRNVTVDAALWLLDDRTYASPDQRVELTVSRSAFGDPAEAQGSVIFSVLARVHGIRPVNNTVISVAELLEQDLPAADVLSAVEAALDVASTGHAPAELRFHEPTGILIARGHPEQIAAVHEVVESLHRTAGIRGAAEEEAFERMRMQEQHADVVRQNHQMRDEIKELTRVVVEMQTRAELAMRELEETRQRLVTRETEVSELRIELERVREAVHRRDKDQ